MTIQQFTENIEAFADYLYKTKRFKTYTECVNHSFKRYSKMHGLDWLDSLQVKRLLH